MLCSAAATFTASINCRKELNTAKTRTLSSAGCVCGKPTAEPGKGNGKSSDCPIEDRHLLYLRRIFESFWRVQCPKRCFARALQNRCKPLQSFRRAEGRRSARLRNPKSSLSNRSFSFQKPIDLREENTLFRVKARHHEGRVETGSF